MVESFAKKLQHILLECNYNGKIVNFHCQFIMNHKVTPTRKIRYRGTPCDIALLNKRCGSIRVVLTGTLFINFC